MNDNNSFGFIGPLPSVVSIYSVKSLEMVRLLLNCFNIIIIIIIFSYVILMLELKINYLLIFVTLIMILVM